MRCCGSFISPPLKGRPNPTRILPELVDNQTGVRLAGPAAGLLSPVYDGLSSHLISAWWLGPIAGITAQLLLSIRYTRPWHSKQPDAGTYH
jgi:hypothetical protein